MSQEREERQEQGQLRIQAKWIWGPPRNRMSYSSSLSPTRLEGAQWGEGENTRGWRRSLRFIATDEHSKYQVAACPPRWPQGHLALPFQGAGASPGWWLCAPTSPSTGSSCKISARLPALISSPLCFGTICFLSEVLEGSRETWKSGKAPTLPLPALDPPQVAPSTQTHIRRGELPTDTAPPFPMKWCVV